ncbi:MAG: hypothetical protein KJ052_10415 [Candidatus Hydrogenedentes bacterium]|nr:hypothetical protein [Candidatus Hydrogenedentota bacterium]
MKTTVGILTALLMGICQFAHAQVKLEGAGGAALEQLAGTKTLVTVVLKSGARDENLYVNEVGDDFLSVMTSIGSVYPYLFSSISSIVVQNGEVDKAPFKLQARAVLSTDQQQVLQHTLDRVSTVFDQSANDQGLRMQAARLLAVAGEGTARSDAVKYLEALHNSNELHVRLQAAEQLYLAGELDEASPLIAAGLEHGNRRVRALATKMAGLTNDQSAVPIIRKMLDDRSADYWVPAARSLALMGYKDDISKMTRVLFENNENKAAAAVFALNTLGDASLAASLKNELQSTTGMPRFRLAQVLYALNDEKGEELLREYLEVPTLAFQAAVILGRDGEILAQRELRNRINAKYDPIESSMLWRTQAAAALLEGGDRTATSVLQEALRSDFLNIQITACILITDIGDRVLIPILQPTIEAENTELSIFASQAVVALSDPAFRDRIIRSWQAVGAI